MVDNISPIRSSSSPNAKPENSTGERKKLPSNRSFRQSMDERGQQQNEEGANSIPEKKPKHSSLFDLPTSNKSQMTDKEPQSKGSLSPPPNPGSSFPPATSTSSSEITEPKSKASSRIAPSAKSSFDSSTQSTGPRPNVSSTIASSSPSNLDSSYSTSSTESSSPRPSVSSGIVPSAKSSFESSPQSTGPRPNVSSTIASSSPSNLDSSYSTSSTQSSSPRPSASSGITPSAKSSFESSNSTSLSQSSGSKTSSNEQPSFNTSDSKTYSKPSSKGIFDDRTKSSTVSSSSNQSIEKENQPIQTHDSSQAFYDQPLDKTSRSKFKENISSNEKTDDPSKESISPLSTDRSQSKKVLKSQVEQSGEVAQLDLDSARMGKEISSMEDMLTSSVKEKLKIEGNDLTSTPPEEISDLNLNRAIPEEKLTQREELESEGIEDTSIKGSERKEGRKSTSLENEAKNISPEGIANTQFSNFQAEISSEIQQPLDTAAVRDLAAQIVDQIQIMTKGDETKTTVTLSRPPILKGATITLTSSENAKKEFNISFANLSNEGKLFIDNQLQQNSLAAALDNRGITVHILTTSTQPEQLFQPSEKQQQREGHEEQQHQQQQREQQSDQREQEQKQRQQQRRTRYQEEENK